jgi:hypothetical protein
VIYRQAIQEYNLQLFDNKVDCTKDYLRLAIKA